MKLLSPCFRPCKSTGKPRRKCTAGCSSRLDFAIFNLPQTKHKKEKQGMLPNMGCFCVKYSYAFISALIQDLSSIYLTPIGACGLYLQCYDVECKNLVTKFQMQEFFTIMSLGFVRILRVSYILLQLFIYV